MEIEAGSEWFHRERLTVVEVDQVDDGYVTFMTDDMTGREHVPDFLRDYARNEPVTLGLLERTGFNTRFAHRGPEWFVTGRFVIQFIDGRLMTYDDEDQPVSLGPESPTLRDLLLTLRVFGVARNIPEVVNG